MKGKHLCYVILVGICRGVFQFGYIFFCCTCNQGLPVAFICSSLAVGHVITHNSTMPFYAPSSSIFRTSMNESCIARRTF